VESGDDNQIKDVLDKNEDINNAGIIDILNLGLESFERQAFLKYIGRNIVRIKTIMKVFTKLVKS
jgi:hypothetical protein